MQTVLHPASGVRVGSVATTSLSFSTDVPDVGGSSARAGRGRFVEVDRDRARGRRAGRDHAPSRLHSCIELSCEAARRARRPSRRSADARPVLAEVDRVARLRDRAERGLRGLLRRSDGVTTARLWLASRLRSSGYARTARISARIASTTSGRRPSLNSERTRRGSSFVLRGHWLRNH